MIGLFSRLVLLFSLVVSSASQAGAEYVGRSPAELGKINFPTSCSAAVQDEFARGVALLHSFWWSEGEKTFKSVLAKDPTCSIAAWGLVSIYMNNPFGVRVKPLRIEEAQAAIESARRNPAKTERERDYLEAAAAYYTDVASRLETELRVSRARAYERLAAKYPEDYEARIFSGLYIAASQNLSDQNFNELRKASAILEPFFTKFPEHPGVAHYLIHSHDTPTLAKDGLKAARRYADIAPAAPHALHMPSHLFTRVGAWEESAAANRRATIAARQGNEPGEALHTVDYTVYAYLQLARDSDARAVFAEAQQVRGFDPNGSIGPYPLAIDPARIAVERGAWKEAAQLQAAPASVQYAPANTHFARALGAARSGYPDAAKTDLERITALRDELVTAKNVYWANEVEVMRLSSAAWIALAENRNDEALSLMRQAADSEDGREKNSLTPARLLPARELLGDMLLQLHRPAEALVAYEASQLREPNRFRGLNGAATAAAQSGNVAKARLYFRQLVELAGSGDPRPELGTAKAYLAAK